MLLSMETGRGRQCCGQALDSPTVEELWYILSGLSLPLTVSRGSRLVQYSFGNASSCIIHMSSLTGKQMIAGT